jgi:hypothetical protein
MDLIVRATQRWNSWRGCFSPPSKLQPEAHNVFQSSTDKLHANIEEVRVRSQQRAV